MGIIFYVLRCSEAEYSSYNQFRSSMASTTAMLRSSGTTFEANKCKVDLKVKMDIISYVLRCSETEYSSYKQFWSIWVSIYMFLGVPKPNIPVAISLGHSILMSCTGWPKTLLCVSSSF